MSQADKELIGKIEFSNDSLVKGRALNKRDPDDPVEITVLENGRKAGELSPSIFRWDLREKGYRCGYHGFIYSVPPELLDGSTHELSFVFDRNGREIPSDH